MTAQFTPNINGLDIKSKEKKRKLSTDSSLGAGWEQSLLKAKELDKHTEQKLQDKIN